MSCIRFIIHHCVCTCLVQYYFDYYPMPIALYYKLANALILLPWLLMLLLPVWWFTRWVIDTYIIPAFMSIVFLIVVIKFHAYVGNGFAEWKDFKWMFTNDEFIFVVWLQFLSFGLLVGSWQLRDSQRLGIKHWKLVPCLLLTMLGGPIGWLAYWILRIWTLKRLTE